MNFLRTFAGLSLGVALLAQSATAQTRPTTHLPTHRVTRMPGAKAAPRPAPGTSAAPASATGTTGSGNSGYAAPGEPINVQDNGKNTPSYDGPAPTGAARTRTTLATPK